MNEYSMSFTRERLHDRHRLSHQQIDRWLGENRSKEFVQEKLKQLKAVKHFLSVTDLLTQNGISFISLKGPLLSLRIYGDPSVRISHDIDLLIDVGDIEPAIKILNEKGYHYTNNSYWPKKKVAKKLFVKVVHHLGFYNNELGICIEVHWVLMHELTSSIKKQKDIIADNLDKENFAERTFNVLTKELELLYLLIHGAKHAWSRMKWLVDINDYPLNEIDKVKFNQLARKLNATRILSQANSLLNRFCQAQLPFNADDRLPRYIIRYALQSMDGEITENLSLREMISKYRYLWLLFRGAYYKFQMTIIVLMRPGKVSLINLSYKVNDCFCILGSFLKRRIFHA